MKNLILLLILTAVQLISFTSEARIGPALRPAVEKRVQALIAERGIALPTARVNAIVAQIMENASMRTLETTTRQLVNNAPELQAARDAAAAGVPERGADPQVVPRRNAALAAAAAARRVNPGERDAAVRAADDLDAARIEGVRAEMREAERERARQQREAAQRRLDGEREERARRALQDERERDAVRGREAAAGEWRRGDVAEAGDRGRARAHGGGRERAAADRGRARARGGHQGRGRGAPQQRARHEAMPDGARNVGNQVHVPREDGWMEVQGRRRGH